MSLRTQAAAHPVLNETKSRVAEHVAAAVQRYEDKFGKLSKPRASVIISDDSEWTTCESISEAEDSGYGSTGSCNSSCSSFTADTDLRIHKTRMLLPVKS